MEILIGLYVLLIIVVVLLVSWMFIPPLFRYFTNKWLLIAINNSDFFKVKKLMCLKKLGNAGNVDTVDKKGEPILILALSKGDTNIITALIKAGVDVNWINTKRGGNTALYYAAKKGYTKIVKELILAGAHVNVDNAETHFPFFL